MPSRLVVGCSAALLVFAASRCGGGDSGGNPAGPTPPPPPPPSASSTVSIVGERGTQSFNPNPASVIQGQTISWRNNDNQIHNIVLNDGSLDTGNIGPGAISEPRPLPTNGANYHCSLHPTMIGSINASGGQPPPCTGPYCDQ